MKALLCLLTTLMLAACANQPPAPPPEDPLPKMFPVDLAYPVAISGFIKIDEQVSADPFEGNLIRYRSASIPELELTVRVFLAGAFISDHAAIDRVFTGARLALDAQSVLAREARERVDHGGTLRIDHAGVLRMGRSGLFEVATSEGELRHLHLASYFVDPYAVLIQSNYPRPRDEEFAPLIQAFSNAWIGAAVPSPTIVCGPPEVVLVRDGLSNVSTNGRVIFLSTETDNIDDSTIAELTRASVQQRKRQGCSAGDADFSAVEAAMRRRSRSR